jgi:hypothetical protein
MNFQQLDDRNYYEHSLSGLYQTRTAVAAPRKVKPATDTTDAEEQEEEEEETPAPASYRDSTGGFFTAGLKISARHDKPVHSDYDNQGAELPISYRVSLRGESFLRLTNAFNVRSYNQVTELSNVNNVLTTEMGVWNDRKFVYGATLSAAVKYYTSTVYDTARFEKARTFVEKTTGKGKPGGKELVPSGKDILVQPQANGTIQLAVALFVRQEWENQSLFTAHIQYRLNLRSEARYLAQRTSTSMMTEDIYNDFFSYQGPLLSARFTHTLPAAIQLILDADFESKQFSAPALNLDGSEIGKDRTDLRAGLEFYLSRYFQLTPNMGLDLFLSGGILRNQSNDSYNDFSLYSIGGGFGIGF